MQLRTLIGSRDCKDADLVIVRQGDCSISGRQFDSVGEQIRILVRLVEAFCGVMMRGVPGQVRSLHISGLESNIVLWKTGRDRPLLTLGQVSGWPGSVIR